MRDVLHERANKTGRPASPVKVGVKLKPSTFAYMVIHIAMHAALIVSSPAPAIVCIFK
jgi:hypothetical protein